MRFVVTAGPTREPIDPVRFISNRSSGKMGYAIAEAALERGHSVVLISGPVSLLPPPGADLRRILTAEDLLLAVRSAIHEADVLIMAAAVADWKPVNFCPKKIKKKRSSLVINFEPTADILEEISPLKSGRIFVGFAAETGDPYQEALRKLKEKSLDLVIANDVSHPNAGFDVDTNIITIVEPSGAYEKLPLMTKKEAGIKIVEKVENISKLLKVGV